METLGSKRHAHYLKREDLDKLVWTAPVSEAASRIGISDVGLVKACRRPYSTAWQRLLGKDRSGSTCGSRAAPASASRRARVDPKNWDATAAEYFKKICIK